MASTIRLGLASVRQHRALYAGSFVAVALGVALIAGVVLPTTSVDAGTRTAATAEERQALDDALSLLGVMAGFAGFMAIFVVSSTFGFVVTARRRELGLLRLVGASPRQVRRQVRTEALVVAVLAAATGAVLGRPVAAALAWLLATQDVTPERVGIAWSWTPPSVAAGAGVGVALLGAWAASRRAAKVPPTQTLLEAADGGRRIGVVRGVVGTLCLAGAVAMLVAIRAGDPLLALLMAIFVPEMIVVGLVCWGPVLLPALARLLSRPFREHPVLGLARENVGVQGRRTTSLAAPVLAISAIAGSLVLTLSFAADWDQGIVRQQLAAPVVVTADRVGGLADDPRVGVLDGRWSVPLEFHNDALDGSGAEGLDPATATARGTHAHRGDLADLRGHTVAISRSAAFDSGIDLGERVRVHFGDGERAQLRVVAIVDDAPSLQADVLVPLDLAHAHGATPAGTWFVVPSDGVSATELRQVAAAKIVDGEALDADTWIRRVDAAQRDQNQVGLLAILGPTGLYAGIAIANTLLMSSLQRRREFAATRLVGASEAQVRRMVIAESGLVTAVALLLGAAVTVAVALLLRAPMTAGLDDVPLTVPWPGLLAIVAACATVAVGAAVLPVRAILRRVGPADAVA